MSIKDIDGDDIVHLPGFWSTAAKVAIMATIPATMSVVSLLAWVVSKSFEHDTRIAVLEYQVRPKASAAKIADHSQAVAKTTSKDALEGGQP